MDGVYQSTESLAVISTFADGDYPDYPPIGADAMDAIDTAQELHLAENDATDVRQQQQLDRQGRLVFWLMIFNGLASLAQILEAIKVWMAL